MLKTKMKISYRFRDILYAEYFASIRIYTETCSRFGVNSYDAMRRLFEGNSYSVSELEQLKEEKQAILITSLTVLFGMAVNSYI